METEMQARGSRPHAEIGIHVIIEEIIGTIVRVGIRADTNDIDIALEGVRELPLWQPRGEPIGSMLVRQHIALRSKVHILIKAAPPQARRKNERIFGDSASSCRSRGKAGPYISSASAGLPKPG